MRHDGCSGELRPALTKIEGGKAPIFAWTRLGSSMTEYELHICSKCGAVKYLKTGRKEIHERPAN